MVIALSCAIFSLLTPWIETIYSGRPEGMPWPPLTEAVFQFGGFLFFLSIPWVINSIRIQKKLEEPTIEAVLVHIVSAFGTIIVFLVVILFAAMLPIINTHYHCSDG